MEGVTTRPLARRALPALATVLALVLAVLGTARPAGADGAVELHLFWLRTCPHCHAAREFLADLQEDVPELVVRQHEVSSDAESRALFRSMVAELGGTARSVPTIIVGDRMWVGFDDRVGDAVRAHVTALAAGADEGGAPPDEPTDEVVDVPFAGDVDVGRHPLLAATAIIALVDGVNPCSLWVLSILLALVLHSGSRRRVAVVGATFLVVTTALYGLYIVGAYSILGYASVLPWIQRAVAVAVGGLAVLNLAEYLGVTGLPSLSIPERAKPGIYRRSRALGDARRSVAGVVAGTAGLAAGVSLVETPCSAALPLLWTDLLAAHDVRPAAAVGLFGVYMAIFLVDELLLFGLTVTTMRATRLQERHGRVLKLATGSLMLGLGVAMFVDPTLLEQGRGLLVVLAIVLVTAAVVAAVDRLGSRGGRAVTATPPADARPRGS